MTEPRTLFLDYNEICGVCDDVDAVQRPDGGYDPICALTGLSFADNPSGRLALSKCPRLNEICRKMNPEGVGGLS